MGEKIKRTKGWFKKEVSKPFEGVGSTTRQTRSRVKQMLATLKHEDARVETFQQAVERLNLTGADIRARYDSLRIEFVAYLALFICITVFFVDYTLQLDFFPASICAGIMLLVLSLVVKASFAAYRIRRRAMGGLGLWARSPTQWWPVPLPPETNEMKEF